jgi:DNA-binding NarL/FixJ family response regulator
MTEAPLPIRIVIADDHSVVRQGLRMFLALDPELEVVGEASDGAEALKVAHELHPDIVLMVGAIKAGAIGYLLKDTQADELCRMIKAAAAGQVQLSPQAAARLVREVRAPESPQALTEREIDVLRLLAGGKANKEIAAALVIGEKTVKTHVSNILMKLGVQSRTQAALYAAQIGLAPLETA